MNFRVGDALDYDPFESQEDVIDSPADSEYQVGDVLEINPFEGQDPYANDPQGSNLDEPDEGGHSLMDIPRLMGKGSAGMAKTASMVNTLMNPAEWSAKAAGLIGDVSQNEALQAYRDYSNTHGLSAKLQQWGETAEDYYDEKLTPAMKASMRKTILANAEEEGFFGEGIKDPWKIAGMIAESIPSTIVSMGGSAVITKGLIQTGLKTAPKIVQKVLGKMVGKYGVNAVAGVIGGAAGEGTFAGFENANQTFEEMMKVPQAELSQSRNYQEIFNSLPASLDDEKKHAYARKILAMAAAGFVGSITAVTTGIFGAPSGAFMGKLIGGEAGKSLWGNLIKGAITEGFFEEAPQSGIERLVSNISKRFLVDPNQELTEGVGEAMASGAISGFVMGGGMAGVFRQAGKEDSTAKDILTDGAPVTAEDILLGKDEAEQIRQKGQGKRFKGPESIEAEEEAGEFSEEDLETLAEKPKEAPSDQKGGKGKIPGEKQEGQKPVKAPVKKQGPAAPVPGGVVQKPQADEDKPVGDRRTEPRPGEEDRRAKPERTPPAWDAPFRAMYTNAQKMDEAKFVRAGKGLIRKRSVPFLDLAKRLGETIEADTDIDDVLKTLHGRIAAGMEPRKRTSEMTEDELRTALNTDYLTGLRNKQAFDIEDTRRANVVSIDLDSLKYFNDNYGHQTGDAMLINFGNAMKRVIGKGVEGYHISGDEFYLQGDDSAQLEHILNKRIVDELGREPIVITLPDGKQIKYEVRFSYGTAETLTKAEEALHVQKAERETRGERAGRGEIPPGLPGGVTKGKQDIDQREGIPETQIAGGPRKAPTRTTPPDTDSATKIKKELDSVDTKPTEGQKDAGNYKKGHIKYMGFKVTIENPAGEYREGKDAQGKPWRTKMANSYGYFSRTEGKDGDEIDLFLGPAPETGSVFIVHQVDPKTRKPDEDKVMLGFWSRDEAKAAYFANYSKDWEGFGSMTAMSKVQFADWLDQQTKARKAAKTKRAPSPETESLEHKEIELGQKRSIAGQENMTYEAASEAGGVLVQLWRPTTHGEKSIVRMVDTEANETIDTTLYPSYVDALMNYLKKRNANIKAEPPERPDDARTEATGILAGKLKQAENKGFKFYFPETAPREMTKNDRIELVGAVSGGYADRLILNKDVIPLLEKTLPGAIIDSVEGKEVKIITPGNKRGYSANYSLVEADALIPSHNPQTFQKNPGYPEGIQERTYHSDTQEQGKVIANAQNLNPDILLTDDPTPTNGPPIITESGIVLGGNSRTMSIQRAYSAEKGAAKKAIAYKNQVSLQAKKFGLTPGDAFKMEKPVLVRTVYLEKDDKQTLHRMASDFNKSLTQGLSEQAEIASMGKNISVETVEKIGLRMANRDLTIRELLGKKDGLEVLEWLINDDAIAPGDKNKYINQKLGFLNTAGKLQIEKALFGSIIDDAELLDAAPKSLQNKLGRALPSLARIKARGDQWDITPELKEALELATKAKGSDLSIREYLKQGSLFGDKKEFSDVTRALAFQLDAGTQTVFAANFKKFAGAAMADTKGQEFLFPPRTFKEAFDEAFSASVAERGVKIQPQKPPEKPPAASPEPPRPAAFEVKTADEQLLMSPKDYVNYKLAAEREYSKDPSTDIHDEFEVSYKEKVKIEETGEVVERDIDAIAYLNDIEDEISLYESLLNCLAGRSK